MKPLFFFFSKKFYQLPTVSHVSYSCGVRTGREKKASQGLPLPSLGHGFQPGTPGTHTGGRRTLHPIPAVEQQRDSTIGPHRSCYTERCLTFRGSATYPKRRPETQTKRKNALIPVRNDPSRIRSKYSLQLPFTTYFQRQTHSLVITHDIRT